MDYLLKLEPLLELQGRQIREDFLELLMDRVMRILWALLEFYEAPPNANEDSLCHFWALGAPS